MEVAEEQVVADFPLEAPLSSICPQTSAHPCTLDLDLTRCCHQGLWGVPEEADPTLDLACLLSSSMDRGVTPSTALRYLVVEVQGVPHLSP